MSELPSGWSWLRLESFGAAEPHAITDGPFGSNLKTADYVDDGDVRVIRLGNIGVGRFIDDDRSFVTTEKFATLTKHEARPGDLVIAALAEPVGRCTEVPSGLGRAMVKADCVRVRVKPEFDRRYLMHALNSPGGRARAEAAAHGMGRLRINLGDLRSLLVPTAPAAEQRRIVAKLEALQTRSERAREAIHAVPPLLEKLRQSVLAAAFRGDLTKDWRAKNKNFEPASKLLERIRTERRQKWEEAELAKMKAKGKPPTDDRWKTKYVEPAAVDTRGLPALPTGWSWATVESLTDAERGVPYGIVLTGDPVVGGVPTVRCGDIKNFGIDIVALKRVAPAVAAEFERTRLQGDEVLIAVRGTVGATAVATTEMKGMNISREVAMIPLLSGLDPTYLMYCLAGPEAQGRVMKHVKGVAQAGINLSDLRTLPVPVPSIAEQTEVLAAVHRRFETCMVLQRARAAASERVSVLDRALLAKAFSGELVAQDAIDQPADSMHARAVLETAVATGIPRFTAGPRRASKRGQPTEPT